MHTLTKIKLFRIFLFVTYPFALIFLYPAALLRKKHTGRLFFFFDRYVIGGAQRVHIDILNSIPNQHKEVFFTRYSPNDKMKKAFYSLSCTKCRDIHFWCDNLLFRLFTVHYYAFYINRHTGANVLSSNSTFFYDMLFFLRKDVIRTELLHNFTYGKKGMEFFGLANYKYLNNRLTVDAATVHNIKEQYKEYNIPEVYTKRIHLIEPGVEIPVQVKKSDLPPLKVLYAGRGGKQKRIYLLDAIARKCIEDGLSIEFHFAGTMMDELSEYVKKHSVLHGEISDPAKMYELYQNCHVILMTSAYEGFPMLIKEGMAYGCIPVVTALEGNKTHLKHMENAYLIQHPEKEEEVLSQGIYYLQKLALSRDELSYLSSKCYMYAKTFFNRENYINKMKIFLLKESLDN